MNTLKTTLTAIFVLFTIISFAQNKEHKEYFENGKVKSSGYKTPDGKKTGEWKLFYENGTLLLIVNYKNDLPEGEAKEYYENGKLLFVAIYKNGKMDGEAKAYYENGKLHYVQIYKNGKRDGEEKAYYESGKLHHVQIYKNDLLEGEEKEYYESGVLKFFCKYVNGKEINCQFYYENGKEDTRRRELKVALEEYLIKSKEIVAVTDIIVNACDIAIYYTKKSVDPEKVVQFPTNLKEIDKEGQLKFDGYKVKYLFKYDEKYLSATEATYLGYWFTIKKEGRKKIEELMRSLSKDCETQQ